MAVPLNIAYHDTLTGVEVKPVVENVKTSTLTQLWRKTERDIIWDWNFFSTDLFWVLDLETWNLQK